MKLLFLACLSPKTGNHTTAERIRSHIESAGHTCELRDAAEFQSPAEVANLVSRNPPFEGALAIHLFRAGRLLLDIQVPFGVIFGGTDINEDVKVEQKRVVMEQVLLKARFAVAFTDKLKEEAELFLLSQSSKIYVQPQGIQTEVTKKFCWTEFLRSLGVSSEHVDELRVFLLVCGLRRVKDPLYLLEVFSEWHCENPLNVLVIIGPKLLHPSNKRSGCTASVIKRKIQIDPVLTVEVEDVVKSRGLLGPGEEPTGASCCHEKVLRRGQQLCLRGHVSSHLGGHGSRGTRVGQGHSRKCSRSAA
ncbi:glycosyltransferase 1 domain-containing protein 1 isoform X6 [Siniperca chuatsi]|uniref:glycosyltransferase 1 domain-containing protein 1 isoform X6 n=1 Tax=Siniperca chuatsi TaxID=119488 RepID=UPI001CE18CDD|nr:glycosyltransferase 1 domain-containing protein 1 isoform X6 [Siniperca chuatsi]